LHAMDIYGDRNLNVIVEGVTHLAKWDPALGTVEEGSLSIQILDNGTDAFVSAFELYSTE